MRMLMITSVDCQVHLQHTLWALRNLVAQHWMHQAMLIAWFGTVCAYLVYDACWCKLQLMLYDADVADDADG